MKRIFALMLACAMSLSLVACGSGSASPSPSASADPAPVEKTDLEYIKEKGEMMFSETGVSGIAAMHLARSANLEMQKGRKCAVVGSLQTRSYDAQDGTKRYVTEVVADEVEFIYCASCDVRCCFLHRRNEPHPWRLQCRNYP